MELLGYTALALLITRYFEPLSPTREWLTDKWINFTIKRGWYKLSELAQVINCPKCYGLWFTLIMTQDLFLSVTVSILSMIVDLVIKDLEK